MASLSRMIVQFVADTTQLQAGMAGLEAGLVNFQTNAQKNAAYASGSFQAFGDTMQTIGGGFSATGSALTKFVTLPLLGIGAAAMKTNIDFETAFAGVRKTVTEDAETHFPKLKNSILDIAISTGIAATEVAGIMQVAGQLGIRGDAALTNFTKTVAEMTLATDMSAESLAMMLGKFINISGLDAGTVVAGIGDVIANLGNNAATMEDAILKFAVRIAGISRIVKIDAEDVFAIAAAAEASGTKAERGGTAMTKIFLQMQTEATNLTEATGKYTEELKHNESQLAIWQQRLNKAVDEQNRLGSSATADDLKRISDEIQTANENITQYTDSSSALRDEINGMAEDSGAFAKVLGLTDQEFRAIYAQDGGAVTLFQGLLKVVGDAQEAGKSVYQLFDELDLTDSRLMQSVISMSLATEESMSSIHSTLETARNADGALTTEVQKRLDTVSAQWAILKEILKAFAVVFTDEQSGVLKEYLRDLNKFLGDLLGKVREMSPEQIKNWVDWFIRLAALGPALKLVGDAMSMMGGASKTIGGIVGRFNLANMVPEDKAKAIGAAGFSNVGKELERVQSSWSFRLGKKFGDTWSKSAFNPKSFEAPVKTWTAGMQTMIDHQFAKVVPHVASPLAGETGPQMRNALTGQFMAKDPNAYSLAASSTPVVGGTTQATALSTALTKIVGLVPAVVSGLANMTLIAGGLAVVLGAVVGGFAMFFVTAGKTTEEVVGIFSKAEESARNLFTSLVAWVQGLIDGLPDFVAKMGEMFPVVLAGIVGVVTAAIDGFFEFLPKLVELGGEFLKSMLIGLGNNFPELLSAVIDIGASILSGLLGMIPSIVKFGFDLVIGLGYALIKAVPALVVAFFEIIATILKVLNDFIMSGKLLELGKNIILGLINGLAAMTIALGEAIMDILKSFWNIILEFFGIASPSKKMKEIGQFIIEGLINGLKAYFELLKFFWVTVPKYLLDAFLGAATWLFNIGKAILKGLWDGISWYYTNLFKAYFNVGKWVLDAFSGSANWLFDIGKNIMLGLKNGIFNIGGQMGRWVSDLGGNFVNGVKNFFGIKSPSRVMMGIGGFIGEGLAEGINGSTKDVLLASEALQQAAMFDQQQMLAQRAMLLQNNQLRQSENSYDGIVGAMIKALEAANFSIYMNSRDVTDVVQKELVLTQRRGR